MGEKTKVLMVQPETPNTFWNMESAIRSVGYKAVMPPLGLMTVAAMLPDRYDVRLIDMNVRPLLERDLEDCDLLFITGMWIHRRSFVEVVRRAHAKGKTIVAGGPFVVSAYGIRGHSDFDYMELEKIDHLILYEAENNLPAFLADLERGVARRVYDDDRKPDLDLVPSPRFDLIDPRDYSTMSLQYSRGCPFRCEFCDIIQLFGRVPRTKSCARFMQELEDLYATGYRGRLFIVDDNFIGNKKTVKQLLAELIRWQQARGYPFLLFTEASVDLAQDDELLDLMVEAGFTSVFVGIETPDAESLRAINKKQNVRGDLDESVAKIQRRGIEVMGGFIVGFDTDTEDIFDRQLDFIARNGIPQSLVGLLSAMPNTDLYRRLMQEGRFVDLGDSTSGDNFDAKLNYVPRMPADRLIAGYKRMLRALFAPRNYFRRARILLSRLPIADETDARAVPWRRAVARAAATATPRSLKALRGVLGLFLSYYGLFALAFVLRSLRYGKAAVPVALNLAFRGRHYYQVSSKIIHA